MPLMGSGEIAFGPVPSRRLGRSLGINNIPPKICSYACVYCQLGRTITMQVERSHFYGPDRIREEVSRQVEAAESRGEPIDYLTFVPDGEPTLDADLGEEIRALKGLGIPIAVITNSSLIWREDVRAELAGADWVSLKVDAACEDIWRRIDRPHKSLSLPEILVGGREFSAHFSGALVTETMLVAGLNDGPSHLEGLAALLAELGPRISYLAIPTRPPAEAWVHPPEEEGLNRAFQILRGRLPRVEYLIGYEGSAFAFTGDVEEDLLSITAVHPMREDAVRELLGKAGADWSVVERLIRSGALREVEYGGRKFYLRRLPSRARGGPG